MNKMVFRLSNLTKLKCSIVALSFIAAQGVAQVSKTESIEYEQLISRADLIYTSPVTRSEAGMPVGNGTVGSLVWTTPTSLNFQINRVDVFAMNASSNNFYQRHTDYCGGTGFVDIDFSADTTDVFTASNFHQRLSCYQGRVTTEGKDIKTRVFASMSDDVMVVEVDDQRLSPAAISINLRALRSPVARRGNHTATSQLKALHRRISLTQVFEEDNYFCSSSVVIGVVGRTAKAIFVNQSTARIVVPASTGKFAVLIASAASFERDKNLLQLTIDKLDRASAAGPDQLIQSNTTWWADFWQKSFVHLHSKDGVADMLERNYTYYLYVMASSSRGKYPAKFNGMLWSTGGDERKWGSLFWGANQSCLYNALFSTNHVELLDPLFSMYTSITASCADAAERQWGSKGLYIAETVAFDGLGDMPDEISEEMRALYLLEKPWSERSSHFEEFARTKLPFLSRWNWKTDVGWTKGKWITSDKGGGPFGHVTHIFSRGAKIAYQYWLKYEYTQDMDWLRHHAYPMLKGVAEFYRNFPNVRLDSSGRYSVYLVNDNESIWGGRNTIEEMSAMHGIFPVAIQASELLGTDPALRQIWKDFSKHLAPLPIHNDSEKWKRALPPIERGDGNQLPDPNTLPPWFFDLCNVEASVDIKYVANNTFNAFFPGGISSQQRVNVLSKLPIAGSLLGRTESTRYLIPNQIQSEEVEVMPNRMDLREGEQTTSIQRLGRAAEAMIYALCQSVPASPAGTPVIHVFPAWPLEWDAQFSLLCREGFLVRSKIRDTRITHVKIDAQHTKICHLSNPWRGREAEIYRDGKRWHRLRGNLFVFPTQKGEHFVIVPANTDPGQLGTAFEVD